MTVQTAGGNDIVVRIAPVQFASPPASDGLPCTFDSFTGQGVVTDEAPLFTGGTAPLAVSRLAGPHSDELPLDDQLITFPPIGS